MPRSFLITKLHNWKDGDVAEDETVSLSDDDVLATNTHTGRSDVDDRMMQIQSLSREYSDVNARINAVGDKSDGEKSLADFIGMSYSRMNANVISSTVKLQYTAEIYAVKLR